MVLDGCVSQQALPLAQQTGTQHVPRRPVPDDCLTPQHLPSSSSPIIIIIIIIIITISPPPPPPPPPPVDTRPHHHQHNLSSTSIVSACAVSLLLKELMPVLD
jgi:hypothetical protein